jgi:two-component system OmpR family response regulator
MSVQNGAPRVVSVLVVEDEPDTRDSLAMLLGMAGHSVRVAGNARTALELIDESSPDVVLIDIGLPGVNGYELARQLRARQLENRPLLIATTGYGSYEHKKAAHDAGMDLHFTKPVDLPTLHTLLSKLPQLEGYVGIRGLQPPHSGPSSINSTETT